MKPKFKSRYVLGEGYPSVSEDREDISLSGVNDFIKLKIPTHMMYENTPKYRLVLERVGKKR